MTGPSFGRLEIYVLGRTIAGATIAFAVISSLILLIDLVETARDLGVRAEVTFTEVFGLTLLKTPALMLVLLPFAFLFGTLGAFVALNRSSELTAMRAAGVSAWRFIAPAGVAAFLVGVLAVTAVNPMASILNAEFETIRSRLLESYLDDAPKDIWLRQGDDRTQMVIHAQTRALEDGKAVLKGVSLFVYQKNAQGIPEFRRRLEAREARLLPGFWRLTDVREASPGAGAMRTESLSLPSTLDPKGAVERFATPDEIVFWRLPAAIAQTEQAGFGAGAYRLRLQQLLATPLLLAAMAVMAAAFSLRLVRLGGMALVAGSGVALGFVFYFLNAFSGALAKAGLTSAFAAAWAPPVVVMLCGVTLLCYTEDG